MKLRTVLSCGIAALALNAFAAKPAPVPVKHDVKFSGQFYTVDQASVLPRLVKPVIPEYPHQARSIGLQGEAEVAYIVNEKGVTEEVQAATATNEDFGKAAVAAVKQWRFKPGKVNGVPARIAVLQKVTFNLDAP